MSVMTRDPDPRKPYDSLGALGWALVPWPIVVILGLIAKHYSETNWFFGP